MLRWTGGNSQPTKIPTCHKTRRARPVKVKSGELPARQLATAERTKNHPQKQPMHVWHNLVMRQKHAADCQPHGCLTDWQQLAKATRDCQTKNPTETTWVAPNCRSERATVSLTAWNACPLAAPQNHMLHCACIQADSCLVF